MSELTFDLLSLLGVIVLVLANAFFVSAEFALVSVRRTRIEELAQQGRLGARAVETALKDLDWFIATTQLGITIAGLGLGWIGEPALAHWLQPLFDLVARPFGEFASRSLSAALTFLVITSVLVVIGELVPKAITLQNPERIALFVAAPTLLLQAILKPAIWLLNSSGNLVLRLLGFKPTSEHTLVHSVQELKMLIEASEKSGVLEEEERDMIHAVFAFGDLTAREVMVPRTEMIAVEADAEIHEFIQLAIAHPYSKLPVFENDLDHIIGIAHVKDLVRIQHDERKNATVRGFLREAIFVPYTTRLDILLQEFRNKKQHLAIVLDEYGGTAGLVTLDDLISQIVGEVNDQFFKTTPEIQRLPDGSALIDGMTLIEEVNDQFALHLKDENYDTIAGFILGRLKRMATIEDVVETEGVRLKVEALDGLRIARISLKQVSEAKEQKSEIRSQKSE